MRRPYGGDTASAALRCRRYRRSASVRSRFQAQPGLAGSDIHVNRHGKPTCFPCSKLTSQHGTAGSLPLHP
jgi:hypothetical protein